MDQIEDLTVCLLSFLPGIERQERRGHPGEGRGVGDHTGASGDACRARFRRHTFNIYNTIESISSTIFSMHIMSRRCVCNYVPTESCPFVPGGRGVARRDGDAAEEALEVDEVRVLPPQSRGGLRREEVWGSAMHASDAGMPCWIC